MIMDARKTSAKEYLGVIWISNDENTKKIQRETPMKHSMEQKTF